MNGDGIVRFCMDGKQRLSSILAFIDGQVSDFDLIAIAESEPCF